MNEQKLPTWQELQESQEARRAFLADEHARMDAHLRTVNAALLDALREAIEQIEGIGIEDWAGAEGLDLTAAREAIRMATEGES
jgi:hypothetical protein